MEKKKSWGRRGREETINTGNGHRCKMQRKPVIPSLVRPGLSTSRYSACLLSIFHFSPSLHLAPDFPSGVRDAD